LPHIKVSAFDTSIVDDLIKRDTFVQFRALSNRNAEELVGVRYQNQDFLLTIKKKSDFYLIKPDSITRPVDTDIIKRALADMVKLCELNIIHSNIETSNTKPKLSDNAYKSINEFEDIDLEGKKLVIEVGFGSGRHLLYQAKKNPDTLFVGIEIHTPSIEQVLKQIRLQGLDNIWIVNYDARLILEMLPSNICSDIYVHFPVPWDKKPHRRVISESFVAESIRVLCDGGKLELRTDSENYYRYSLEVFSQMPKVNFLVQKNYDIEVKSKYEDRWRAQDKNIYTLSLLNDQTSDEKVERYDFAFERRGNLADVDLPTKAIIKDGYFVHFEDRFDIVGGGILQRVAFGSFDRPEHRYILDDLESISYYPNRPVNTLTNYKAHKLIKGLLDG